MKNIITLTMNPAVDRSTRVENVSPDRKLRCEQPRFEPGGGGINVSRTIRLLGGSSTAWYTAGGPTGDVLRILLEEANLSAVLRDDEWV